MTVPDGYTRKCTQIVPIPVPATLLSAWSLGTIGAIGAN